MPVRDFARLLQRVRRVGRERLARTYQTTFWFDLGAPSCVVEEAALALRRYVPSLRGVAGVEWWLSRMKATNVQVDFHQDRDERLALKGGPELHPRWSSVLFLNRVRGGALAVTEEPACDANPARAPERADFALASPRPNRFVVFQGTLTHGVLDAHGDIPIRRLAEPARLRLAVIMNWWDRRPTDVPTYAEAGVYRALSAAGRRAASGAATPAASSPGGASSG